MTTPSTISSQPPTEFGTRLVTLSDGRPGIRGGMHVEIREPKAAPAAIPSPRGEGQGEGELRSPGSQPSTPQPSATLEFIASDETLDRYDEIIAASGWKLEAYRRNPVFQNAHKYGDVIFTLGRALATEVRTIAGRQALCQTIEFAVDVNPMAKIAHGLYRGKFLNAVSVGFIPLRWENGPGPSGPSTLNSPTLNQQFRRRYIEQELLEVSAVGIPANPNALALALKSGAVEKSDLQDTLDLLRGLCDSDFKVQMASPAQTSQFKVQSSTLDVRCSTTPISPIHPIGPISPIPAPRELLALSRTLRDLLRHI